MLFNSSTGEEVKYSGKKENPFQVENFDSREESRSERDELITKQEMELALGLMKTQIVEEIRCKTLRSIYWEGLKMGG